MKMKPLYPGRKPSPQAQGYHHEYKRGDRIVTGDGEVAIVLLEPGLGRVWVRVEDTGERKAVCAWSSDYLRKGQAKILEGEK